MKLKYLAYYAPQGKEQEQNREATLSAVNKIDYICSVINRLGYDVEVLSASRTMNTQKSAKGFTKQIKKGVSVKYLTSTPTGNIFKRVIRTFTSNFLLFAELLKVKKNENIIAYHSLGYMSVLNLAHRIKKFRLIVEVEEIYSDVIGDAKKRKKEVSFLKRADAYIFPTELLNEKININKKPYTIVYGTYNVENARTVGFEDERKHIVYAGTFDPRKGGAIAAVSSAEYLDEKYHLHILGFGSEEDKTNLISKIEKVSKLTGCAITYDGLLSGEEYIKFIQSCDVGLSTQNPNGIYNDTSFPSKILSYMTNGLRVVSINIPVVKNAKIGQYMYFYNEQTPQQIAHAIKSIDFDDNYDSRKILAELDFSFTASLEKVLF